MVSTCFDSSWSNFVIAALEREMMTTIVFSEENIPDKETVDKHGGQLDPVLEEDSYIFLAYAGTFLTVGLQWYVHHSLLHVSNIYLLPMLLILQSHLWFKINIRLNILCRRKMP